MLKFTYVGANPDNGAVVVYDSTDEHTKVGYEHWSPGEGQYGPTDRMATYNTYLGSNDSIDPNFGRDFRDE